MTTPGSDVHDLYIHVVDTGPLLRRLARIEVLLARIARAVNAEGEIMTEPTTTEPVDPTEDTEDEDAAQETAAEPE